MANILERYGIKEVADVTFYDITDKGKMGAPVLFLDTLKVSTIEQTAEQAEARGGKGNPPLVIWDYGKEITVTLEDALFSAQSMAIMFGDDNGMSALGADEDTKIYKTIQFTVDTEKENNGIPTTYQLNGMKNPADIPTGANYYEAGSTVPVEKTTLEGKNGTAGYVTFEVANTTGSVIEISANTFPGTYYVTGDTYARSEVTGKDEFFQFIIPKAKVQSENTITLEAEGDPSVFNMSLRVMRPADGGAMMKLVKYSVGE